MVCVLSKTGQPLMPGENHGMVRSLLKTGKAKVVRRTPFTVQMLITTHCSRHLRASVREAKLLVYQRLMRKRNCMRRRLRFGTLSQRNPQTAEHAGVPGETVKDVTVKPAFKTAERAGDGTFCPAEDCNDLQIAADVHKILPVTRIIVETASRKLSRHEAGRTLLTERRNRAVASPCLKAGVSAAEFR